MSFWPGLPLLSYGLWMAWSMIAFDGSAWLSDVETDGASIVKLYIASGLAFSFSHLAVAFLPARFRRLVDSPKVTVLAGAASSLGCLLVILAGPYYLGPQLGLNAVPLMFDAGSILAGIGNCLVSFRIAVLYSSLPPRRSLLYAGLSQILIAFVYYFTVGSPQWPLFEGGPSLVGVFMFIALPGFAALLAVAESPLTKRRPQTDEYEQGLRVLPLAFAKFCVVAALLGLAVCMVRSFVVGASEIGLTLEQGGCFAAARLVIAFAVIVVAFRVDFARVNFGRVCTWTSIIIVVGMTCAAVIDASAAMASVAVYVAGMMFEMLLWLLLAFYAYQKRVHPILVFGLGRGFFMLAGVLGWAAGAYGLPVLSESIAPQHVFTALAAVLIVASFALFTEGTFSRLFSSIHEEDLSLSEVAKIASPSTGDGGDGASGSGDWLSASMASLVEEYRLTPREAEVLRLLAVGKGSEAIAQDLCVSWNTARSHIHNIYLKMEVHSRGELTNKIMNRR